MFLITDKIKCQQLQSPKDQLLPTSRLTSFQAPIKPVISLQLPVVSWASPHVFLKCSMAGLPLPRMPCPSPTRSSTSTLPVRSAQHFPYEHVPDSYTNTHAHTHLSIWSQSLALSTAFLFLFYGFNNSTIVSEYTEQKLLV